MNNRIATAADNLIQWLITFSIIAVPAFYIYGKGDNYFFSIYDIYKEVLIQSIAVILLGLLSLRIYFDKDFYFKKSLLLLPLALFYLVLVISITQMENYYEGWVFFKRWLSYLGVMFVVIQSIDSKKRVYYYLNWLIFIATLFAFYGTLQIFGIDFKFLVQNFKGNATDGNPNFAGEYISMIFPLSLWLVIGNIGKKRSFFYLTALIITGFFLIINRTKAAWVGVSFSVLVTGITIAYLMAVGKMRFQETSREKKIFLDFMKVFAIAVAAIGVLCSLCFVPAVQKLHPGIEAFSVTLKKTSKEMQQFKGSTKLFRSQEKIPDSEIKIGDTTMQRVIIWQNTLHLIKDNPILGVGLGNFKISFQPYRTRKEQLATGPDVFVRRTHNEYLQFWAELGPFGLVFFFMIQFVLYGMALQIATRTKRFQEQCLAIGFFMSLVAIFTTSMFGFPLQSPNPVYTVWLIAALLASFRWILWYQEDYKSRPGSGFLIPFLKPVIAYADKNGGKTKIPADKKKYFIPVLILAVFSGIFLHYWIWKPATAFYNRQFGQALQRMGLHEKAAILFRRSLEDEPLAWETRFLLANEYASMNQFQKAIEEHNFSLELNPYHAKGHYNLANTLHKLNRMDEAVFHYEQAVKYDNMLYQGYTNLGAMYFKKGLFEDSIRNYKRSIDIKPDFFSAQYNVAYALYGLGRIGEAIPYLQKAKLLQPDNDKVLALEKKVLEIIRDSQLKAQAEQRIAAARQEAEPSVPAIKEPPSQPLDA